MMISTNNDISLINESFSELFKDAFGFRPRGHWFYDSECTDIERKKIWDDTLKALQERIEMDRIIEAAAIQSFEKRVEELVEMGAGSIENALKWLVASIGLNSDSPDWDEVSYEFDLPYGFFHNKYGVKNEFSYS